MRNPALVGGVLFLLGLAVCAASAAALLVAVIAAGAAHAWVVTIEEPRLRKRLGPAYATYLERVPRWLPRIGSRRE